MSGSDWLADDWLAADRCPDFIWLGYLWLCVLECEDGDEDDEQQDHHQHADAALTLKDSQKKKVRKEIQKRKSEDIRIWGEEGGWVGGVYGSRAFLVFFSLVEGFGAFCDVVLGFLYVLSDAVDGFLLYVDEGCKVLKDFIEPSDVGFEFECFFMAEFDGVDATPKVVTDECLFGNLVRAARINNLINLSSCELGGWLHRIVDLMKATFLALPCVVDESVV